MKYLFAFVCAAVLLLPSAVDAGGPRLGPLQAARVNRQTFRQDVAAARSAVALRQSACVGPHCQQFRSVVPQQVVVPQAAPLLIQSRTLIYR